MNDTVQTTAAQCALALPEIVSMILQWICLGCRRWDSVWYFIGLKRPILDCGLVNWVWFHQAMRYLWKKPIPGDLPKLLEKVTPQRQQLYANLVEEAGMCVINGHRVPYYDAMLRELRFPKLKFLTLRTELGHKQSQDFECHIPRLGSNHIKTVFIDCSYRMWPALTTHEMHEVLRQIPAAFPEEEDICFDKAQEATIGAKEWLAQQLPGKRFIFLNFF